MGKSAPQGRKVPKVEKFQTEFWTLLFHTLIEHNARINLRKIWRKMTRSKGSNLKRPKRPLATQPGLAWVRSTTQSNCARMVWIQFLLSVLTFFMTVRTHIGLFVFENVE